MTSTTNTNDVPQSVAPSIAFEIPIKKELTDSPPVQKRLAAQAHSPRKEVSLDDINKKLSLANKRKEDYLADEVISKASNRIAQVNQVSEKSKEKTKLLEQQITTKLANAEAKRNDTTATWMQRLSQSTKNKLSRGAKVLNDEKWTAKELESKIDIKGLSAELRREELKLKTQEELAISNNDKLRRGRNVFRQEEEDATKRLVEMEARLKAAEERKLNEEQGKVEGIAAQINDKLQRAANVRQKEEILLHEKSSAIENKIVSATQRRDNLIKEQQDTLLRSASKKERMIQDKLKLEKEDVLKRRREMETRIRLAEEKKSDILTTKSEAIRNEHTNKQARARETWLTSLKQGNELKQTSEKRLKDASEKKQQLTKEIIDEKQSVNKNKIDKVDKMLKTNELSEMRRMNEIEQRLATATTNREHNLIAKSSASKKRILTPRGSPTSKTQIEEKIDSARSRREIYLTSKVEKAKNTRITPPNKKINKELFAATTPKQATEDDPSTPRLSPRIKAARLEEFQLSTHDQYNNDNNNNNYGHLHLPFIVGLSAILAGLLSFLRGNK